MHKFTLTLLFIVSLVSLQAKDIEVCADCQIQRIKKAIALADRGDRIILKEGVFNEYGIVIDKPLSIIGMKHSIVDGGKDAVIDGGQRGEIFTITADSVTIEGLTIVNVARSYTKDHAAIRIHRAKHFTIKNNILRNVFFGILVEKSHHGIIDNNNVSSNAKSEFDAGNGIHIWHSSGVKVSNNKLTGLRDGIYFEFVTNSIITNNVSTNNVRYGLHFMFSNHDEYYDNRFENNGAGVAVMFSKFIIMKRNVFTKNWGSASYGLLLKEISDAEIENNVFEENTLGIDIDGTTRINYRHNEFINNGWAIKITGGCYENIVEYNNFIANAFDLSIHSKVNDNSFNNNYWSDYAGYDLDKDGIGDIPYRPVKLFNYIVNKTPESIVMLRSLFIDIINFSEKVSPVFTPDNVMDSSPLMKKIKF